MGAAYLPLPLPLAPSPLPTHNRYVFCEATHAHVLGVGVDILYSCMKVTFYVPAPMILTFLHGKSLEEKDNPSPRLLTENSYQHVHIANSVIVLLKICNKIPLMSQLTTHSLCSCTAQEITHTGRVPGHRASLGGVTAFLACFMKQPLTVSHSSEGPLRSLVALLVHTITVPLTSYSLYFIEHSGKIGS